MMKRILFYLLVCSVTFVNSQDKKGKQYKIRTVAFYNLENLFDTINDVTKNDEASPIMEMKGGRAKVYWDKIDKLASVIEQIGKDKANTSPAIIGVAEVENRTVLEDLIKSKRLKSKRYGIIHYESPDKRGIDVALLYQQRYFKPIHHESFDPKIYREGRKVYTRNQLLVSGYLDDELIHVIVNHWPSRSGGEARSRPLRERAAYQNTKIIEKLQLEDPNAKIITMGDFNDDPINSSFKKVLKTKSKKEEVQKGDLYNPYESMFKKGFNTLGYRDNINLFDQILFTSPLLDKGEKDFSSYKMFKSAIFNKSFLTTSKGRYKGYPFRSFSFGSYTGGYSDHYPVYIYLIKDK
ncbi:endonuclease/exonuclease/phosphatase family protein [Pseudotenacibaculum sp. MALMAid0570]|uniref:endonuclease/exonuclease/phosphatase family protein n=1 Tax=Pseudotenacibaculum sp. MALMAid0570 TaxID=3143938 RepID=UPI0032DF8895